MFIVNPESEFPNIIDKDLLIFLQCGMDCFENIHKNAFKGIENLYTGFLYLISNSDRIFAVSYVHTNNMLVIFFRFSSKNSLRGHPTSGPDVPVLGLPATLADDFIVTMEFIRSVELTLFLIVHSIIKLTQLPLNSLLR